MTSPFPSFDVATLPPTQYLILEVLAARYRLGETYWTFPDRLTSAARKLEQVGLVWLRSGPAPNAFEARFTDAGRAAALAGDCTPPGRPTLHGEHGRGRGVEEPPTVDWVSAPHPLETQMPQDLPIPDPRQARDTALTACAYLIAYAEGGRVNWAGADEGRAHELARNTGGMVCQLPVVGDYTPRGGEDPRPPMEYEEIGFLDDDDPDERSEP